MPDTEILLFAKNKKNTEILLLQVGYIIMPSDVVAAFTELRNYGLV